MHYGLDVRAERNRAGLTQSEAARILSIHIQTLVDVEKGRCLLSREAANEWIEKFKREHETKLRDDHTVVSA